MGFVCGPNTGGVRFRQCETCVGKGWLSDEELAVFKLKKEKHIQRRNERIALNLSMREMAERLGMSLVDYSSYEHGRRD